MTLPALQLVKDDVKETQESPYRDGEPLFEIECEEPEGLIKRKVYLAKFTPQFLQDMYEKQRKYRTLMGREILTYLEFLNFFITEDRLSGTVTPRGLCFVIDDLVGIFWLSDIHAPAYAEVHYTFFDGRHRGRLNLVREGIKYIFSNWGFNCIYVCVGLYARIPLRFVESVGFKKEGRLRQRVKYKGSWWDLNCYSLLKEEVLKKIEIGDWK